MKCTECNDTRVYLGLGTAPPEPCRACQPQSAAASTSFYPVGHVPSASGSRNEFRSQAKMSSFHPLWQGLEFGRSVISADVGGPMNLIPSSDTDTTKLSFSSLSDGQYLVRDRSSFGGADLSVVPTIDLQSFANWVQASMKEDRPTCKYAAVQSIDHGWTTTSVKLRINGSDPNGRALIARLDAMAFNGDFQQACRSWSGETPWVQVDLEWLNPVKVELTREPTAHEIATRQLPPLTIQISPKPLSNEERQRISRYLLTEIEKQLSGMKGRQ